MANKRIQDLEQTTDLTNDDLLPLDTTKKTFATTLKSLTEWLKGTFQTTANLEQTLSDAIDKYPSSKVLKDESSRIVSIMDNKVSKFGDTMTGNLTTTAEFHTQLNQGQKEYRFINTSGQRLGSLLYYENNDYKTIRNRLWVTPEGTDFKEIELTYNKKNKTIYTQAPLSNHDNSILTTVSHGPNYVRFGNGVQICWQNNGSGVTITLPQAFINTNYRVTFCQTVDAEHNINNVVTNKTTTSFKFNRGYTGGWIAIGYWH